MSDDDLIKMATGGLDAQKVCTSVTCQQQLDVHHLTGILSREIETVRKYNVEPEIGSNTEKSRKVKDLTIST